MCEEPYDPLRQRLQFAPWLQSAPGLRDGVSLEFSSGCALLGKRSHFGDLTHQLHTGTLKESPEDSSGSREMVAHPRHPARHASSTPNQD